MYLNNCVPGELLTNDQDFEPSNYLLSTINAVYAVAAGLDATLTEFCGLNYVGVCQNFLQAGNLRERFAAHLKLVSFLDPTSSIFRFLDREGNMEYQILRFDGSQYVQVSFFSA